MSVSEFKSPEPAVPETSQVKEPVIVDYLKERAEKREKKGHKPDFYYRSKEVKKHLRKDDVLSPKDQYDEVRELSRALNEKADMKAQQVKADNTSNSRNYFYILWIKCFRIVSAKKINDVSSMLLESINSKLLLLDKLD